jgi:hypothetical protein
MLKENRGVPSLALNLQNNYPGVEELPVIYQ